MKIILIMNQFLLIYTWFISQSNRIVVSIRQSNFKRKIFAILSHTGNGCNQFLFICNRNLRCKSRSIAAFNGIASIISYSCSVAQSFLLISKIIISFRIIITSCLTIKHCVYTGAFRIVFHHPIMIVKILVHRIHCHKNTGCTIFVFFTG